MNNLVVSMLRYFEVFFMFLHLIFSCFNPCVWNDAASEAQEAVNSAAKLPKLEGSFETQTESTQSRRSCVVPKYSRKEESETIGAGVESTHFEAKLLWELSQDHQIQRPKKVLEPPSFRILI